MKIILFLAACLAGHASDFDARALLVTEFHDDGEVKHGWGLAARHWCGQYGADLQLLVLTPRDSIIDRSDLFAARRWEYGSVFAGWGYDREDREHGPSLGASAWYPVSGWLGEISARSQHDLGADQVTVLTIGIGRKF